MDKIKSALNCKCPNCKEGDMFSTKSNFLIFRIPKMNERCKVCDYKFERETGFFFGAMFVSYALAAAEMIAVLVVFWYLIDLSPTRVFGIIIVMSILLSSLNYKLARSIWLYMFHKDKV